MTKLEAGMDKTKRMSRVEGVSKADRTRVIILSQIVTIVGLLVLWSILRSRQPGA
ncbi:MAG: hypothetical protein OEM81_11570 [Acidimicrobiia bacterium]|nr:hypothetical protein [Acidimicrobiia bacterium]MDH3398452.1 hypothetical protein [Acidimicrobiia bacterium]MDH5615053.1 hypothetical protein [Acidimicrobiia bacterium]